MYPVAAHQIRGNGYVVDALEAALWCFWTTDTFFAAVLAAANPSAGSGQALGDDADTTAAICGQVAGAYYGQPRDSGSLAGEAVPVG